MPKKKKAAKKKPSRKLNIPRPHNNGQWTAARFRGFVYSAIRRASWPPKYDVLNRAFVREGINPKTGRKCKLHRCEQCGDLFAKGDVQADHIIPAVGPEGFQTWDLFIERMFIEQDGFQILCKEKCHQEKTNAEREERNLYQKQRDAEQQLPGLEP